MSDLPPSSGTGQAHANGIRLRSPAFLDLLVGLAVDAIDHLVVFETLGGGEDASVFTQFKLVTSSALPGCRTLGIGAPRVWP
jgi:hypothetical protein